MGIQIWSGYNQMQSYYKAHEIPVVSPEEVKKQQQQNSAVVQPEVVQETIAKELPVQEDTRSRSADLENLSLTFNKEDTYEYLGSESGLASLDMQKAISDMKKDSILQEYQYFVGSSQNFLNSEDGIVLPK